MPKRRYQVDHDWFKQKFAIMGISQREFGRRIGVPSPSLIVLAMQGRRRFQPNELAAAAEVLQEPIEEMYRRTGQRPLKRQHTVHVDAVVGAGGVVQPTDKGSVVPLPEAEKALRAVRYNSAGTDQGRMHGWTLYAERRVGVPADAVGSLCVVRAVDSDVEMIRHIERGIESGLWDLSAFNGTGYERNVALASAHPVKWIRVA